MDHSLTIEIKLPTQKSTCCLGKALAAGLEKQMVVYLLGELGAGKTTLAQGILRTLGYKKSIKSPTYTLVETYSLPLFTIHHFDLYRFNSASEWEDAGLNDYFSDNATCLIEWADKVASILPLPDWQISLLHTSEGRLAKVSSLSALGQSCLLKTPLFRTI